VNQAQGRGDALPEPHAVTHEQYEVEANVVPHRWRYAQTVALNDLYDLGPGTYELIVGTRTLMGEAAGANAPATGWPYVEGSATVGTQVKIVP
jgi:hypothetical protein